MESTSGDTDELPFHPEPLPAHIAIIMDGNGRWAHARGQPRVFGHRAGAESVRRVLDACGKWGIRHLTLYAFSTENWKRPPSEVTSLMKLLVSYLRRETDELARNNVRLRVIGDLERLPPPVLSQLRATRERLAANTGSQLILALSYGARDEIVRAARALAREVQAGRLQPAEIDEERFASALDTVDIPDPDLVIRTAGEMRLSNFLLWQASYAEYYSCAKCWPEFSQDDLAAAIRDFQSRKRKFGAVLPPE